jgi:hypothetical protein
VLFGARGISLDDATSIFILSAVEGSLFKAADELDSPAAFFLVRGALPSGTP